MQHHITEHMKLQENFLASWETIRSSRRTLLHIVSYFVMHHSPWHSVLRPFYISLCLNVLSVYTWSVSVRKTGHTTDERKKNQTALRLCHLERSAVTDNAVNHDTKYRFRTQSCYTMPALIHKTTEVNLQKKTLTEKGNAR